MHPKDVYAIMQTENAHHHRGVRDEANGLIYRIDSMLIDAKWGRQKALREVRAMCAADAKVAEEHATSEPLTSKPFWAQTVLLHELAHEVGLPDIPVGPLSWEEALELADRAFEKIRRLRAQLDHNEHSR